MSHHILAALIIVPSVALAAPTPPKPPRLKLRDVVAAAHACARRPAIERAIVRPVSGSTWAVEFPERRKQKRLTIDAVTGSCDGKSISRGVPTRAVMRMPDVDLDAVFAEGDRCTKQRLLEEPDFAGRKPRLDVGSGFALLVFETSAKQAGLVGPPTLEVTNLGAVCNWIPGE